VIIARCRSNGYIAVPSFGKFNPRKGVFDLVKKRTAPMIFDNLNFLTLAIFAPVLVLTGILGFIIPPHRSPTSGALPYNIFHIAFGLLGAAIVLSNHQTAIRAFNAGFGLIDVYQAVASYLGLFPKHYFKWTRVDDLLHVVIGALLIAIGIFGR
jgi:hypothetical protein